MSTTTTTTTPRDRAQSANGIFLHAALDGDSYQPVVAHDPADAARTAVSEQESDRRDGVVSVRDQVGATVDFAYTIEAGADGPQVRLELLSLGALAAAS